MRSIEVGRSPALVIGIRGAMPMQWAPHLGAAAPVLPKEDKTTPLLGEGRRVGG
jgi:hypothetical protein